jgi:lactoylglutathione lyase
VKFCWTTISVSDLEKSLAFYQGIIGLKLNRRMKPNPKMELAFLGEGDTQLELIHNKDAGKVDFGTDISLGFVVESLEEISDELKTKGIGIHSGPFQPNPFIRFLYVTDPDGLKIQFVENIPQ